MTQILNAILRQDLISFIHKSFRTINPDIEYIHNWHIDLIVAALQDVVDGKTKRLIINMPPRSLKSLCISVAFPAWLLGLNPAKRILVASYAQHLSIKHSMDTRFLLNSSWYKSAFPGTILSQSHNQKSKFLTTEYGFRFASSVGGSVTGEGGDLLIIDDPHNPTYIHSQKIRMKAIEWFENSFSSRLNDRAKGAIIIVMQRLHPDDLCGYLEKNGGWDILKIPAIYQEETIFKIGDQSFCMNAGDVLHKERCDRNSLIDIEREIGRYNFAAQYMQNPISEDVSLLEKKDISFAEEMPVHFEYYLQSWDSAIKTNSVSDYSVCSIFGICKGKYYLLEVFRKRLSYPCLKETAMKLYKKYKPRILLIEDKASGASLIQDLRREGVLNISAQNPKLDKLTRFASIVPLFQSGKVILPERASWLQDFLDEVTNFPNSKHDDIVDSVSQLLNFVKDSHNNVRIREVG